MVCKFVRPKALSVSSSSFYINYVVCKFEIASSVFSSTLRFILTMWYVNNTEKSKQVIWKQSFILTMWYVNIKIEGEESFEEVSFILTMWYVNLFTTS